MAHASTTSAVVASVALLAGALMNREKRRRNQRRAAGGGERKGSAGPPPSRPDAAIPLPSTASSVAASAADSGAQSTAAAATACARSTTLSASVTAHTLPRTAGGGTATLRVIQLVFCLAAVAALGAMALLPDCRTTMGASVAISLFHVAVLELGSTSRRVTINVSRQQDPPRMPRAASLRISGGRSRGAGQLGRSGSAHAPLDPAAAAAAVQGALLLPYKEHISLLPYRPADISGLWIKDHNKSDSMQPACDLMQLHGLVRKAIRLMRGVQIRLTDETFRVSVVSAIPLLKVTEQYNVTGEVARFKRRDLRRGQHYGRVEVTARGIVLLVRWEEPLGGYGHEVFRLVDTSTLHVDTEMRVGNTVCRYCVVYNRRR